MRERPRLRRRAQIGASRRSGSRGRRPPGTDCNRLGGRGVDWVLNGGHLESGAVGSPARGLSGDCIARQSTRSSALPCYACHTCVVRHGLAGSAPLSSYACPAGRDPSLGRPHPLRCPPLSPANAAAPPRGTTAPPSDARRYIRRPSKPGQRVATTSARHGRRAERPHGRSGAAAFAPARPGRMTILADVVAASTLVGETSARSKKVAILAELLRALEPEEVPICVGFLSGVPRQGRVGIGYATVYGDPGPRRRRALADRDRRRPGDRRDRGATGPGSAAGAGRPARRRCSGAPPRPRRLPRAGCSPASSGRARSPA